MKVKYVDVTLPYSLDSAVKRLLSCSYVRGGTDGYEMVSSSKNEFSAKYIKSFQVVDKIVDPFGEEEEVIIKKYLIVPFAVSKISDGYVMRIENPPRSVRDLIKSLASVLGFGFSVAERNFDLLSVWLRIEQSLKNRPKMLGISLSSVKIGEGATAKVEIVSSDNAYFAATEQFGRFFGIDKIKVQALFSGALCSVIVRKGGILELSGEFSPDDFENIEHVILGGNDGA